MKTSSSSKGYLVVTTDGQIKKLGYKRLTWLNDSGTLFPTYEAARNAIRRTITYAESRGYCSDCWLNMHIVRVEAE